ncbi:cyclin-I2 isoform X2 [Alligator sinensis]|uniref:Cyclin-I2 isoform X2 n=1 Tax=Alligator sinensis TaxID=38654 RepID=A0A3Q0GJJ0_ALLSI|nr:cyclin-I2 isoform X2 [Alligator sinensis]
MVALGLGVRRALPGSSPPTCLPAKRSRLARPCPCPSACIAWAPAGRALRGAALLKAEGPCGVSALGGKGENTHRGAPAFVRNAEPVPEDSRRLWSRNRAVENSDGSFQEAQIRKLEPSARYKEENLSTTNLGLHFAEETQCLRLTLLSLSNPRGSEPVPMLLGSDSCACQGNQAMKYTRLSENQRLALQLENALAREARLWKAPVFQNFTLKGTDISPWYYQKAVLWIAEISSQFQFYPETFALAINFLNRLLASVKAQLKYLRCIAIACLVLAAKINEEDEIYFKQGPRPCSTEQRRLFCLRFCWQNVTSLQDPLRHRPRQDSQRVSPGGSSKRSSSSLRWYKGDGHKHDLNLSFSTSLKREKSISSPVFRAFCQAMPSYSQSPSPSSKYQQKNVKAAGIRLRKPPLITRLCNVLLRLDLLVFFKLLKTTF